MKRSSGILLPVFSLPSDYGIGSLGKEAHNFIDFLNKSGQGYWQMLPLGPTGFGDSPYQNFSVYAGNPYFIDLDALIEEGLLQAEELAEICWGEDLKKVDYEILYKKREVVLRKAFGRFCPNEAYRRFCDKNSGWLEDYGLFMALKGHFNNKPWHEWEDDSIRSRRPEQISVYAEILKDDIEYHRFVQYIFFKQWNELRSYAKKKSVKFIGDLPIYISMDSADAWASVDILQFDEERKPTGLGGVPPDYFSKTGQLWGNPLYDWDMMKADGYGWWMRRIKSAVDLYDAVRLDHFRGFESYWRVPYGAKTAIQGEWVKGPGIDFINVVKKAFPELEVIAEDLGCLTEDVYKFVEDSGFPGMKVLQFAFESGNSSDYLPHRYKSNSVVYTGTHDNNTVRGWLEDDAGEEEKALAEEYFALSEKEGWNWGFIRGAMRSVAGLCVVQIQDYLDLPSSDRINTPGTVGGNWQWRLVKGQLDEGLAEKIAHLTWTYER